MATISHHTRACPQDISGLLICAYPSSHCVVTVTLWLGLLAGEEGRGAGECSQKAGSGQGWSKGKLSVQEG